jgi:hypothetical protein
MLSNLPATDELLLENAALVLVIALAKELLSLVTEDPIVSILTEKDDDAVVKEPYTLETLAAADAELLVTVVLVLLILEESD